MNTMINSCDTLSITTDDIATVSIPYTSNYSYGLTGSTAIGPTGPVGSISINTNTSINSISSSYGIPTNTTVSSLDVTGSIKIKGEDLNTRLGRIETLLNIPVRDVELENKYPRLKQLWIDYNTELEKYKTWERLNDNEL